MHLLWSTLCTWIDACYFKATFSFSFFFILSPFPPFLSFCFCLFLSVSFPLYILLSFCPIFLFSFLFSFMVIFIFLSISFSLSLVLCLLLPLFSPFHSFLLSDAKATRRHLEETSRASFLFVNKDNLFCYGLFALQMPYLPYLTLARPVNILSIRIRRKYFLVNWEKDLGLLVPNCE